MKVLFLTRRFFPDVGGVEKHVLEISHELISRGHSISIITESQASNYHSSSTSDSAMKGHKQTVKSVKTRDEILRKIKIQRFDFGVENKLKKFKIWWTLFQNRELIRYADVIHCHDVFFWYLPFKLLYPKKKIFTTFHGYESYPTKKKAILIRKLSEKLSNGNICIGDFIPKWYGTHADIISYGAVDLNLNKTTQKPKKESAVFIGRLDSQTGIEMYDKAVKIIKEKHPKFEVAVIGDGDFKKKIKNGAKVFGFRTDIENFLPKYQFAFISRYLGILEAMTAMRLVFAVFDNPLKEDYLKLAPFAPFIVISNSAQDLAKQVDYYLNHTKEADKMIVGGYKWVKNQTWGKMADDYVRLWKTK